MSVKHDIFENCIASSFDLDNFVRFVKEFFNSAVIMAPDKKMKEYSNFSNYVEGYSHVANYVDPNNNKIAIFAVELRAGETIERARHMQRNFVKKLIDDTECTAALVAFYTTPELNRWRLSLIKLDYEFSKGTVTERITPAKRYSYLVGEEKYEPCHTAKKRLLPIFLNDSKDPALEEIENAFSVEPVTKEFFDLYCQKYLDLKEYLEGNEDFVRESKVRNFTSEQFAKKLMGQIVFLYFIQKKGWLGVPVFKPSLSEKEYKNAYYRQKGRSREVLPQLYKLMADGRYRIDIKVLTTLTDEDEEIAAKCFDGEPWGSGPKNFMREIFEGCIKNGKNFFDDYLEPLFYTGLNMNRGDNSFYAPLHRRVPFLNGGLFEELDGYEWEKCYFGIPNRMFSNKEEKGVEADGILDIFDRYNFTMNEDEPLEKEVAIDPEMLGKVFENLLDVKNRKSKGAFYTPREIVHYMCQESLINYLVNKTDISESAVRDFILYGEYMRDEDTKKTKFIAGSDGKKGRFEFDYSKDLLISKEILDYSNSINRLEELDEALATVTVVDPAVGSGAFPLGMLNEIVKARNVLTEYMAIGMNSFQKLAFISAERKLYTLKTQTIKNCIYACDIEPSAVDIAKLRLWLSIVIEDEIHDQDNIEFNQTTKPRPLPNLDYNIICGNSLVDEFKGVNLITESYSLGNVVTDMQIGITQEKVDSLLNKLIHLQKKLFFVKDHREKEDIKHSVQEIYNEIIVEQLKLTPSIIPEYYATIDMASQPFILWQLSFPNVFQDGGFDICIGNPPYVGERKHKEVFEKIQGSSINKYYLGRMDYFYFFFHLALNLLKDKGTCSLITTNYYLTALGGKTLRNDIKERADIIELFNFNETKVFDTALGQHNIITTLQKGHFNRMAKTRVSSVAGAVTTNDLQKMLEEHKNVTVAKIKQEDLYDGEENYIRPMGIKSDSNPINSILDKIVNGATDVLGNVCNPLIGLESSLDNVYVLSKEEIMEITNNDPAEMLYVKEFFKGSMIHRYQVEDKTDKYILYLHEKIEDITSLRGIWNYLQIHEDAIKGRKGANLRGAFRRGNWWVLNTPRLDMDFADEKIVTHYRTKSLRFALSTEPWYASRDVYYITKKKDNVSLKYILALLNSSLYYQWFYNRGKRKGDTLELYAKPLKEVPIKEIPLDEQQRFVDLVDRIIERKKSGHSTDELENEIDLLVYDLYGLEKSEIDLIEANSKKYGIV